MRELSSKRAQLTLIVPCAENVPTKPTFVCVNNFKFTLPSRRSIPRSRMHWLARPSSPRWTSESWGVACPITLYCVCNCVRVFAHLGLWYTSMKALLFLGYSLVTTPMPTVSCSLPHTSETSVFDATIMPFNSPVKNLRCRRNSDSARKTPQVCPVRTCSQPSSSRESDITSIPFL